jgi:hypothetical protein
VGAHARRGLRGAGICMKRPRTHCMDPRSRALLWPCYSATLLPAGLTGPTLQICRRVYYHSVVLGGACVRLRGRARVCACGWQTISVVSVGCAFPAAVRFHNDNRRCLVPDGPSSRNSVRWHRPGWRVCQCGDAVTCGTRAAASAYCSSTSAPRARGCFVATCGYRSCTTSCI